MGKFSEKSDYHINYSWWLLNKCEVGPNVYLGLELSIASLRGAQLVMFLLHCDNGNIFIFMKDTPSFKFSMAY